MSDTTTPRDTTESEALAAVLALLPTCTQCGKRFTDRACGVTHAIVASNPLRHRLFEPLLAARDAAQRAEAWDEGWCVGASNVFVMAGDRPLPQVNPYRADEQKCPDFVLIDGNEWHCILPNGHDDGPNSCDHDRRRSVSESEGR